MFGSLLFYMVMSKFIITVSCSEHSGINRDKTNTSISMIYTSYADEAIVCSYYNGKEDLCNDFRLDCIYDCEDDNCISRKCENMKESLCNADSLNCVWECDSSMTIPHDSYSCCKPLNYECKYNSKQGCMKMSPWWCVWNEQNCTTSDNECVFYTKVACGQLETCTWDDENSVCLNISSECSENTDDDTCDAAEGCWWLNRMDEKNDKSLRNANESTDDSRINEYNKNACLRASTNCKKNADYKACQAAHYLHCIWDKENNQCITHMQCSESIDDYSYEGTLNVTCDNTPCEYWENIWQEIHLWWTRHDDNRGLSLRSSIVEAQNYCRKPSRTLFDMFERATCYTKTQDYKLIQKPCCVKVCDRGNFEEPSKCQFTKRMRYEYAGSLNVSCSGKPCQSWTLSSLSCNLLYYNPHIRDENLSDEDFPVDQSQKGASNYCRNPFLFNLGDMCVVLTHWGTWLENEQCCNPPCAGDDQVMCMWSNSGIEYSGKVSVTCSRIVCIPWYQSLHKLMNLTKGLLLQDRGILERFPDHSLEEASNYCRNPTRDPCGPWCYTSLVDDSRDYCCVPDCTAANKEGKSEGVHGCMNDYILRLQVNMRDITEPLFAIVGIALNVFSINVFSQDSLAGKTTSTLFKILAIADSFALVLGPGQNFIDRISNLKGVENSNNIACKMYWPIRYFSWAYPGWILVCITLERHINISNPLIASNICNRKWVIKHLVGMFLFLIVIYVPNIYYKMKWSILTDRYSDGTYNIIDGDCASIPTEYWTSLVMTTMVYIDFIMAAALPFIIMITYNILIIIELVKTSIKRRAMNVTNRGPDVSQLTMTLLAVSFIFMLLSSPSAILVLGWNYFGVNSGHSQETIRLWRSVAKMLLNMNSSFNFLQYACTGKSFRIQSKNLLLKMKNYLLISIHKLLVQLKIHPTSNNIEMNNMQNG